MSKRRNQIDDRSLHSIMLSKRANIYYIEKCRIVLNGGRVEYITDESRIASYYNIPIANTSVVLLGNETSISTAAMRELSRAGVCVGFCGGGGTPLYSGTEIYFQSPQNEYRKTQYIQKWCSFWFCEESRLSAAKTIQECRINFTRKSWRMASFEDSFLVAELDVLADEYTSYIKAAISTNELLGYEGAFTSRLYSIAARSLSIGSFSRAKMGSGIDRNLDVGNYLSYGLAASALWVLGIPHGLPLSVLFSEKWDIWNKISQLCNTQPY